MVRRALIDLHARYVVCGSVVLHYRLVVVRRDVIALHVSLQRHFDMAACRTEVRVA